MTREEAIRVLRKIKEILRWGNSNLEALDMAIESLEKEERETNLEHYALDWKFNEDGNIVLAFDKSFSKFYKEHSIYTVCELLLEPYEPPKYKVSQFEYDLLECCNFTHTYCMSDFWLFEKMLKKGYLKDIPSDITVKDILDNCEVTD